MGHKHFELTDEYIIEKARAYYESTGKLPTAKTQGFSHLDRCLREGGRGLPGGSSLSQLLIQAGIREYKSKRTPKITVKKALTEERILSLIKAYIRRYKEPPIASDTRPIDGDLTWNRIEKALYFGNRGLTTERLTLRRFMVQHRIIHDDYPLLRRPRLRKQWMELR